MRPLRVLLIANDGFSVGHVARMIAIAGGLARVAERRALALQTVLATTSSADALLGGARATVVRLPAPEAGRRGGLGDVERRSLVRGAIAGIVDGFAPDLLVADTFPSGPHGELAGVQRAGMQRALVRRATAGQGELPPGLAGALTAGLAGHALAVLVADPGPLAPAAAGLGDFAGAVRPVAPIARLDDALDRGAARAALGLDGRVILVAAGGGGDRAAADRALSLARAIVRIAPDARVVLATGPLAADAAAANETGGDPRIRAMRCAPLATVMRGFDGAFAPAGYNTAHELAALGVPAALFAQPRTFDDQAARAARLAAGGWAHALVRFDDDAIAAALAWMARAVLPPLATGGEGEAAEALIALATGAA
ncbi:MAG TPA: hypothetical protein VGC42_23060 [Kofleriaceae bacterium]